MASSMDNMKGAGTSQSSKVQFPLHIGIGTLPHMMTKVQPQMSRRPKSMKSQMWGSDNHGSLKSSKWIQENLEEMDHNVKRMMKLIEEEDVDSSTRKKPGRHNQKKPELIHLVDELSRMYRSLADRYDHATGEVQRNIASDFLIQSSGGLIRPDLFQLPGGNSTDESSYLEYSESESDESSVVNSSVAVHPNEDEHKILVVEEELKRTKEKLHDSENEVGRLMEQLKKSQETEQALQSQLETVMDQALELADRDQEIRRQKEEITNAEKRYHQEEMMKMEKERSYLEKKVNELEVWCQSLEEDVTEKLVMEASLREEIRRLKEELTNADKSLSQVKTYHQEEIIKLEKERSYLENKVTELEVSCQTLGEDVTQVQTEKSVLEASLRAEIEQLQTKVSKKMDQLSEISQDYNRAMDEKDQLNARVEEFITEMRSKEDHLNALHLESVKMTEEAGGAWEKVEKLKARVEELEEKVAKQEEIILEGAEGKREAIRQLCFSLEHYRVGYQELRESILSHRRFPAAMAF